jgi:glutaredoxin-like YruB-family protein
MKQIGSLNELREAVGKQKNVWLLLHKKGSEQSECAIENYSKAVVQAAKNGKEAAFCTADVLNVRDIHPAYAVTSVPALLHFEDGEFRNLIKGCHRPEQFNSIFDRSSAKILSGENKKREPRVTVYTTPACTWCNTIKRHFQEHGVQYREVNVSLDQKAAEDMVRRSGQQGVPQTDINGEIIVGFDKTRINRLLGIN